jgi:hypothetical protein
MKLLVAALSPWALWAGCLSFTPPPERSRCVGESPELIWQNAPAVRPPAARSLRQPYDELLANPALQSGVSVKGEQRFSFRGAGKHLLEIFLANPEADRVPFRLFVDGRAVDERPVIAPGPGRMRPKTGLRFTTLLGVIDGPSEIALRTEAPSYLLSAVRWTPLAQFESEFVPRWRERLRFLHGAYLRSAKGATARRHWMQQLSDRLAYSGNPEVREEALLGRTRAWFWLAAENHEPDDILQTDLLFREGLKLIPEHPILRQMITAACFGQVSQRNRMPNGPYCQSVQPVPWQVDVPPAPASAPAWAVAQRRLMRRMEAITRWWVEKRQAANGELGGGWGDDVEILRHWGPQALGFGSEAAARGIRNLAGGLWHSGTLLHGYDRGVSDVEHSSEPTTDTQPLAAALHPFDPELRTRLRETAACAEHWIKPQPDGFLRFRSSWFNCREADTTPARAVDVHMNARAVGPALWYAYLERDPSAIKLLAGWADSWIRAMRQTAHGKPAGVFPPAMRSADGSYLIGGSWDKPDVEWDYFQWNGGAQEAIASLVLAVYDLTGERKYLDAVTGSFAPCLASKELCARLRESPSALFAWRRITGDARYDATFGYRAAAPDSDVLSGLARMAREAEERFSVNWDMFTTEVLYTDGVYYPLPAEYRWHLFGGEAPRGDRYPTFAVTFPAGGAEFARAVLEAEPRRVRLRAYSFEETEREVSIHLWRLQPGKYTWKAGAESGGFTVTALPHLLTLRLPPRRETTITIERAILPR